MHAAYHRGPASSATPSSRESVPATLPQLRGFYCLNTPPPLGPPTSQTPPHATAPRATAPARNARPANARGVPPRPRNVSCVIHTRLGASDAIPSSPTSLPARPAANRLAPRNTHHPLQPRAQLPNRQIHPCTNGGRKNPPTQQPRSPMRISAPYRFSDVSCVIIKRLGASDAAPSSPIRLPARTAAPRPAPSQSPLPATALHATAPAHSTQHLRTAGVRMHPLTAQLAADAQRTSEVQRHQLRHQ
jgi:hypothetical protein